MKPGMFLALADDPLTAIAGHGSVPRYLGFTKLIATGVNHVRSPGEPGAIHQDEEPT